MARLHFSPRPNRAREINWRDWGTEAFREAQAQDKLVLLAISGVWCHWCHVMDETSYSHPSIIKLINEHFIPIRVDTDQRPDINERYNLGGWPTTAILTPGGELVTGGTYIPPDRLAPFLQQLAGAYRDQRETLLAHIPRGKALREETEAPPADAPLPPDIFDKVLAAVEEEYDHPYGGFGQAPKFPMPDVLDLVMQAYAASGRDELKMMFTITLSNMAGGGMYDPVEGGFFRYSTTRDWSIPHFEKMLEDNAGLLGNLLLAYQLTGVERFAAIARDVLRYLTNNLYLSDSGGWAGTQDADEAYYGLPWEQRQHRTPPYIDRTIYTNWNALLAQNLIQAAAVLNEDNWLQMAVTTLDMLWERCFHPAQGMAHYYTDQPYLYGLLADQTAMGKALSRAYQATGERRWLKQSRQLADFCLDTLQAVQNGFYDKPHDPKAPGALARPLINPIQNAHTARWLLELAALGPNDAYTRAAHRALSRGATLYSRYGLMAASFALAAVDATRPWTVVRIVGKPERPQVRELLRTAMATYSPRKVVHPLFREEDIQAAGIVVDKTAQAYTCIGTRCLPPLEDAEQLRKVLTEQTIQ